MRLIEKITFEDNIKLAIENIRKNKGSKTPGTDGLTIDDIIANEEEIIKRIKSELCERNYKPKPVRRIEIPKGDGKTRPLGIPTIYDRIVQQCLKQVLEPIIDPKFHPNSFGFRPGRSTENALALNNNLINRGKLYFVVDIDIKEFFDNINHKKLIKQLYKLGIKEKKVLAIIKAMLRAEIELPNGERVTAIKGTPQGGVLSPLLANVVLNELDWWIDRQWRGIKLRRSYGAQNHKERALKTTKLSEVKLIRYADDFRLIYRNRGDAEKLFKLTKQFLKNRLKLEISKNKSKVINLMKKPSEFLGFKIKAVKVKRTRIARTWIRDKAKENIKVSIKKQIKKLQKDKTATRALKYNSMILGIQNYYSVATMVNEDMCKIGYIVRKILYNRIGKSSIRKDIFYQ